MQSPAHHPQSPATPEAITLPPQTAQLRTLSNGLEVVILEDDTHPLTSVQLWVKAGSIHEEQWLGAGLAHLVEHMFFKGTERRSAQQISQEIKTHGGSVNAYTTFDRTVYWIDGLSDHVENYLDILADMAQHSRFDAEELAKEQDVIRREFAMGYDDADSELIHLLLRHAYREHPMRHPVIGHLDVFNQAGRDQVLHFVNRHYVPNNCFLVITGAVEVDTVMAQVEKHFGTWTRRPYEPVIMPQEPEQMAPRRAEEEFPTEMVRLYKAWHIHGDAHPDQPALDVLGFILGSGRSSRLNLELRDRLGIVHHISAGAWSAVDRGLFSISAGCDTEDLPAVETEIENVVERLKNEGCKQDELDKAVRATLGYQIRSRSSTRGMASSIAHTWMSTGNLDHDRTYLERISSLTTADIANAARKYLIPQQSVRVSLHPTGTLQKTTTTKTKHKREEAQRFELSNGAVLIVGENARLPLVSLRAQFLAGVPVETEQNAGVTQVTAQWLSKGTAKYTDEQIATLLEERGGGLSSSGDAHRLYVGADVMKGDESLAMELASQLLLHPTFPDAHLAKIKKRQIAAIKEDLEDPLTVAMRRARTEIFTGLPYARIATGTVESVQNLTVHDCRELWQSRVQGRNGVISVFGDVQANQVRDELEALLSTLPAGERSLAGSSPMPIQAQGGRWDLKMDKKQGVLVVGFPTVGLLDAAAPTLNIINEACSSMGSRLFNRIREELGLAYYVGAQAFQAMGAGAFYFYVGADPAKMEQVEAELNLQIADLAAHGLKEDELARGKTTWKAAWLSAQQGNGAMADTLAWQELNGHGFGYHRQIPQMIDQISLDHTQEIAARFFDPARAFVVRVTPQEDSDK